MFFQTQIGLCVVLCSQILQWCSIAFGKILWCALQVFGGHIIRRPSMIVCMHAKLLQSCITLYGCMDCSPPVSSVHGVLQARILEWVAMPSSRGSSWLRNQTRVCLLHWQADSLPLAPPGKPLLPSRGHKILLQSLKNSEFSNNIFFISRFSSQCLSTHYLGWFFFPQVEYLYPYS